MVRTRSPPRRNPEVDFKGQERCNDTHESTTDADELLIEIEATAVTELRTPL